MAEGNGLLNRHRVKSLVAGSNPALSAIPCLACTVRLFYSGGRISASSDSSLSAELRVLGAELIRGKEISPERAGCEWGCLKGVNPFHGEYTRGLAPS